jgi:hypothetical protein
MEDMNSNRKVMKTEELKRGTRRYIGTTYEPLNDDVDNIKDFFKKLSNQYEESKSKTLLDTINHARERADLTYRKEGLPNGSVLYAYKKNDNGSHEYEDAAKSSFSSCEAGRTFPSNIPKLEKKPFDHPAYLAAEIHSLAEHLFAHKDDADSPSYRFYICSIGYLLGQKIMELNDLEGPHIDTMSLNKGKGLPIGPIFETGLKQRLIGNKGHKVQTGQKKSANQIILKEAQELRRNDSSISDVDIANQIHNKHRPKRGYSIKTISKLIPKWTKEGFLNKSSVRKVK